MMIRTDRRRFPILIAAIAALALAMTLLFSPVQAQEGSAPDKPTGLSATATHDQVVLTWDDPGDASITGYVILRRVRVNNTGGEFSELVADTGTAATTYTDDSVQANTTYTYRIKAINEHGVSERSRWFHIDVPAAPEPEEEQAAEPPDQPTGLDATATHDQVVLTWDDPDDDSITGYVILRRVRVNNTGGEFSELVADTGTAATTYTDDSVQANTTYTYRIKATNEHGVSERSRWFHINVPAAPEPEEEQAPEPPDQPTGLDATATHDSVTLTWDDPGDDTITGYVILRRVRENDTGGEFSVLVADTGTAATTYTDDSVQANTTYTYRIKAINEHGVSERSRWFHIDTPAAPEAVEGDDLDGEDDDGAPGGSGKRANVSEPDGGDLPVDNTTTGEVDVGGSVTGNIGFGLDGDWFKVVLEAGTRYQIDLEGADTSRGTLPDPRMGLYASNALVGSLSNDEGVGKNARRIYTPTAAGDYYVRAQNSNGSDTGTYTLSMIVLGANGASEADTDFPATTATSGRVEVGGSVTGNRGSIGDTDWFAVVLEAGKTYQIDQKGEYGGGGTLEDPYLDNIRDSSGNQISSTFNNDVDFANGIFDSQIIFTPTAAGTYYLVAFANGLVTGTYTLSVRDITPPPCTLNTGDIWCGVVTVAEVKTTADALVGHGFADGAGLSAGSLAGNPDDTMFSVGDNDYTIMAAYIQVPTGTTLTGTLYVLLSADLTEDDKAGLVLTVDDTTLTFAFSGATKGTTGLYSWGLSGLTWSAGDTVTVRLSPPPSGVCGRTEQVRDAIVAAISSVSDCAAVTDAHLAGVIGLILNAKDINSLQPDDFSGLMVLHTLDLGRNELSSLPDGVFSGLTALHTLLLPNNGLISLPDGVFSGLTALENLWLGGNALSSLPDGVFSGLTALQSLDLGGNALSSLPDGVFSGLTALNKLTLYYNELSSLPDGVFSGLTALTHLSLDNNDLSSLPDGVFSGLTGLETLELMDNTEDPLPLTVTLERNPDAVEIRAVVRAGAPFAAPLSVSVENGSLAGGGTTITVPAGARESAWVGVTRTDEATATTVDIDLTTQPSLPSDHSGYAFVKSTSDLPLAFLQGFTEGATDLPTNVSEPDGEDLPEGITTTGRVEVGGSVTGEIAPALDVDWFAVELKKGKRYQFDVEGADTGRGNLADPHLWGLQDAGGQAVSGARSNDGGVGKNGRVIYTPDAEGTYYIAVSGAVSTTGTYTLSVIVLGANGASEADTDFPRDTTTTGRVEVGASATGNIDPGEDLDGFRVNLEAGKRYRFDLEGADTGRGSQADPILALYGDSFNVSDYISEDDDGGEGLNSRLTYTATATGIYHLEVAGLDPGTYTLSVREILLAVAVPPGGLGPSEIPGAVRNVSVSYSRVSGIGGQIVWWDAPDETGTGAQWITEFRIYGSASEGCGGYLLDAYEVEHPGSTTPPEHPDGTPTGFKYFKIVYVGPVKFGVAAVNELGEGPCEEGPDPPSDTDNS